MKRKPAPSYPPGFFTELIRKFDWPPGFVSRLGVDRGPVLKGAAATAQREHDAKTGAGWGTGTLAMGKTPKHRRPEWME